MVKPGTFVLVVLLRSSPMSGWRLTRQLARFGAAAVPVSCSTLHDTQGTVWGRFKRRTFTFGFGTGNERTEVRLKEGVDTVLCWRKEATGDKNAEAWHEIDLADVKIIEPKGRASLVMSSRTGDLLLELEATDGVEVRDSWVESLGALLEDVRKNPQAPLAQKSVKDRVKEEAQKQRHFAKRSIEMQKSKKEADARKARYMQETGGMQYTAVAMANRS